MRSALVGLLFLATACAAARRAPPVRASAEGPVGCYRFDRPLGSSATGDLERADSAAYTLELRPGGAVARPGPASATWRRLYARNSAWRQRGDTLLARVFTGLVGWDLALVPDRGGFAGVAQYLSDAVATGWTPPRVTVRARREACASAPPT